MRIDPGEISADQAYFVLTSLVVPRPIAWVTTLNEDRSVNVAPFSFFTGLTSDPPMVAISVGRRDGEPKDTWRNAAREGELVVSVVTEALLERMNLTSAELRYGESELALAGLTAVPSERVRTPRLAESPAAMECRLDRVVEVGRSRHGLLLAEVLLWHVADELVGPGRRIDVGALQPLGRLVGSTYCRTTDHLHAPRPRGRPAPWRPPER